MSSAQVDVSSGTPPGPAGDVCEDREHTPPPLGQTKIQTPPTSTPVRKPHTVEKLFSTTACHRNRTMHSIGAQMATSLVGPMPVEEFLDTFLPPSLIPGYSPVANFKPSVSFKQTTDARGEMLMYAPFVKEMEPFAPQLRFVDTHSRGDKHDMYTFKIKPDISVYPLTPGKSSPTHCDISQLEVFIEFKWNNFDDPFRDPSKSESPATTRFTGSSKYQIDTLGQLGAYAAAQLACQFRTHAFSVYILRKSARIIRWDREGAIITKLFSYDTESFLAEFFSRLSQAPRELRGIDTTVSESTGVEATRARDKLGLDQNVPMFKTTLRSHANSPLPIIFAMPRPHPSLPSGRATRACPAYHVLEDSVVFFKDSWRIAIDDIIPEGIVYAKLNAQGVRFVPGCLASGDVECSAEQKPQTKRHSQLPWVCQKELNITPHSHYQLVLDIVGKSLTDFSSSKELVQAVRDILLAHSDAFGVGFIHRDISAGNIIIFEGRGYLIDWEFAKDKHITAPRRVTRTGTWQFMSTRLVENNKELHELRDDLESTFWVLLWTTLLFYQSGFDTEALSSFVRRTFESNSGTEEKRSVLTSQTKLTPSLFPTHRLLFDLIKDLADLFKGVYLCPSDAEKKAYATVNSRSQSANHNIEDDLYKQMQLMMKHSTVHQQEQSRKWLEDHTYIISCYDKYLGLSWPTKDGAQPQPLLGLNSFGEEDGSMVFVKSKHELLSHPGTDGEDENHRPSKRSRN